VECKNKSNSSNNRGNWNHFKVTQKLAEQSMGKYDIKELKKSTSGTACLLRNYWCKNRRPLLWKTAL